MELTIKKMHTLKLFWQAMSDLVGLRGARHELNFPTPLGSFDFVKVILEDKKNNKFQFALYRSPEGKEYIAKQLSLKSPGIDEYWLRNEIAAYSMLTRIYQEKGDALNKKFSDVKIPKLALVLDDDIRLLCLMEKISGKTLLEVSLEEEVEHVEKALNYFKWLNSTHNFKNEILVKRNFINMFPILILKTLGALVRYPKEYPQILKGLFVIVRNFHFLLTKNERAFVHRDISQNNILIDSNGIDYVIDFELAGFMHPMWEVVQTVVGCKRREGFLSAFNKTATMQGILSNKESRKLYKLVSIYCGIHLLGTSGRNENQVLSDKWYMRQALSI